MSEVRAKIDIKAAPEQVYDVMLDPNRLHEWVTIHRKVNRADSGEPREGFVMDQTLCLRHANFKVHWTLTDAERPLRATWEGRGPAGSYARTSYKLTPNGDGTHFEYENEFKAPGGFLGAAASPRGRRRGSGARGQALTGTTQSTPRTLIGNVLCGDVPRSGIPCERSFTHCPGVTLRWLTFSTRSARKSRRA